MTRDVLTAVALVGVYLLMLASTDLWDLLAGAVVAVAVVWGFRRFLRHGGRRPLDAPLARAAAFLPFVAVVLRDIIAGTWHVARVVLHLRPLDRPGIVAVPFGSRTPRGVVVSAFVATLSPGEFLVDVDEERRVMLMHVLDARDPDAVRARLDAFYDRWQKAVFP